ncbi:HAD domain-containing protein [Streptomyces sp. NPDC059913]|uniref:HAD domain-containing protein n=1 Tax=unclassified Streptomyces TaxID=2593676 RepID=UPI00364D0C03
MSGREDHPLLFLDIDGPLLPFGDGPQREPSGATTDPHLTRLDPRMGPRLAALPCELVWATTWEDEANAHIAPRLGLSPLPVVHWPDPSDAHEREDQWYRLHWKTRTLAAWADGRPFARVDDGITGADQNWVNARHPAPTLLHPVTPSLGLTDEDFAALDQWLRALRAFPRDPQEPETTRPTTR